MSPENLLNETYSFPVDIWCFGCVLYKLMNFKLPFEGSFIQLLQKSQSEEAIPFVYNFSPKVRKMIHLMLENDQEFRIKIEHLSSLSFLPKPSPPPLIDNQISPQPTHDLSQNASTQSLHSNQPLVHSPPASPSKRTHHGQQIPNYNYPFSNQQLNSPMIQL
jgi:serine/threonine protein kinase